MRSVRLGNLTEKQQMGVVDWILHLQRTGCEKSVASDLAPSRARPWNGKPVPAPRIDDARLFACDDYREPERFRHVNVTSGATFQGCVRANVS